MQDDELRLLFKSDESLTVFSLSESYQNHATPYLACNTLEWYVWEEDEDGWSSIGSEYIVRDDIPILRDLFIRLLCMKITQFDFTPDTACDNDRSHPFVRFTGKVDYPNYSIGVYLDTDVGPITHSYLVDAKTLRSYALFFHKIACIYPPRSPYGVRKDTRRRDNIPEYSHFEKNAKWYLENKELLLKKHKDKHAKRIVC